MRLLGFASYIFYGILFFSFCPGNAFAQNQEAVELHSNEETVGVTEKSEADMEAVKGLLLETEKERLLAEVVAELNRGQAANAARNNTLLNVITVVITLFSFIVVAVSISAGIYINGVRKIIKKYSDIAKTSADSAEKSNKSAEEAREKASKSAEGFEKSVTMVNGLREDYFKKIPLQINSGESIISKSRDEVRKAAILTAPYADAMLATIEQDWNDAVILWRRVSRANPNDKSAKDLLERVKQEANRKAAQPTESPLKTSADWNNRADNLYQQALVTDTPSVEKEKLLQEAWEAIIKSLEIDCNNTLALFNKCEIGKLLLKQTKDMDYGKEIADSIRNSAVNLTAILPNDLEAWAALGDTYMAKSNLESNFSESYNHQEEIERLKNAMVAYKRAKGLSQPASSEYCICLNRISQCYYELAHETNPVENLECAKNCSREAAELSNRAFAWGTYAYQAALLGAYTKNIEVRDAIRAEATSAADKSYNHKNFDASPIDGTAKAFINLSFLETGVKEKKFLIERAIGIRGKLLKINSNYSTEIHFALSLFELAKILDDKNPEKLRILDEAEQNARKADNIKETSLGADILGRILLLKGIILQQQGSSGVEKIFTESLGSLKRSKEKNICSVASYYLACYYMLVDENKDESLNEFFDALHNRGIPSPVFLETDTMNEPFRESQWYQYFLKEYWKTLQPKEDGH